MSGGVDSSVAACLLVEAGYEVLGSHMSLIHGAEGVDHGCCGPTARRDAEAVARIAGFPFEVVDLSAEFEATVLADFVAEHEAGRTPNPCGRCNEQIKFGAFLRRADALGIDLVATGHYVRTARDGSTVRLLRGRDRAKDQSYMLAGLGQRELSRALFPVGDLDKSVTRDHARRLGLPVAAKPDSQEVCFVPGSDHANYLAGLAPHLVRPGDVVDAAGRVVGSHEGTFRFTVGQRRGIGVATSERRYVLGIDHERDRVVVGPGELLARAGLTADRVRWVADVAPADGPFEAEVQVRYRSKAVPATIEPDGDHLRVRFAEPQRAIAPGQMVVVARGDDILGSARITASSPIREVVA